MNAGHAVRQKTYVALALMVAFSSLGNILLSKGMKQVGEIRTYSFQSLLSIFLKIFNTPSIWLGIASLLIFFVCYLLVLSWADYSYVQPASAIGYAVVPLLGTFVLGEIVSLVRWAGILLICAGVVLVSGTEPRTTKD